MWFDDCGAVAFVDCAAALLSVADTDSASGDELLKRLNALGSIAGNTRPARKTGAAVEILVLFWSRISTAAPSVKCS